MDGHPLFGGGSPRKFLLEERDPGLARLNVVFRCIGRLIRKEDLLLDLGRNFGGRAPDSRRAIR
jgi:hypothetical protein